MATSSTEKITAQPTAESAPLWHTVVPIAILVGLNFVCFVRSLKGYFLADDFIHIPYLARVFAGHPELLLRNFYSNWMQTEGTQFYRPLISISLALDYAFWHVNAFGYHLTNILLQTGCSIFLFLSARRIYRSVPIGLAAGALFSVFPLHCEVASWIIARVDSVATMFYLAAFWLFLRADQEPVRQWSRKLSLVGFCLSLLSKETAITLPAALSAYAFFFSSLARTSATAADTKAKIALLQQRVRRTAFTTWPFWLMLAIYLILRTLSLGTFTGGYQGSIGSGLSTSIVHRFLEDGSFARIFYPLNAEVFGHGDKTGRFVRWLYTALAVVLAARTFVCWRASVLKTWLRNLFFPACWFFIAFVPVYQVFNLTTTLQGSRFIYMATAPLCLLLAVLVSQVEKPTSDQPVKFRGAVNAACMLVLFLFVVLWTTITLNNNEPWVQAGIGVRALKESIQKELGKAHIALLNLPQSYRGAHMLYNGAMFSILMSPPLSDYDYSQDVLTFEPVMYGDSNLIDTTRLKRLIGQKYQVLRWNEEEKKLEPVELILSDKALNRTIAVNQNISSNNPYVSPDLELPVLSVGLIKVDLTLKDSVKNQVLQLSWSPAMIGDFESEHSITLPLKETKTPQTVTFPVSEIKRWVGTAVVDRLRISLPTASSSARLANIEISSGDNEIPKLSLLTNKSNSVKQQPHEDAFGVTWTGSVIGPMSFDASQIPGASSVVYELSKRDCWFEHYSGVLRDKAFAPEVSERKPLPGSSLLKGETEIKPAGIKQAGYYNFRIFAVSKDGKVIGYSSDPINLWLEPPSTSLHESKKAIVQEQN